MASKHMVTCVECGRRFDANYGGTYNRNSRRYTCQSCVNAENAAIRKANAEKRAAEREAKTGMRQSLGAMIVKIVFGTLFVLAGFGTPEGGWSIGYFLTAQAMGGGLIAWAIIPWINAQRVKKVAATQETDKQENTMKMCASCGAMGKGHYCEYCGSKYEE